jgi:UDP-galactopyranose mutase
MNTFHQLWNIHTPEEAKKQIENQTIQYKNIEPKNLEEQALKLVGKDIYEKLIKGYTEKQWGRKATEIPSFIIKRIPLRFTYNNNYFNDTYQGIPKGGYNRLIKKLIEGASILLETDFLQCRSELAPKAKTVVYTGMLDAYFDYCFGELEYRSLRFENQILDTDNYQGNAVVNYTSSDVPYTRIIEHKHFEFGNQPKTYITKEYPSAWKKGMEAYYPINDTKNEMLLAKYNEMTKLEKNVLFGGRLAQYKYYDMDKVILAALECVDEFFS